ncbi:MAG: HNH endonuclease [Candidatus Eisenbacteria bacterium]
MRAFLAVTDNDWFRFLRAQPGIDEVNFWQPSGGTAFRALQTGQPFLFKLHHPENFVVGGGFFAHFSLLPARLAWEAFGIKNGAAELGEMWRRIAKYRHRVLDERDQQIVGCIILVDPFFLDDRDWIPVPKDFSPNIVRGKGYDLSRSPGRELWSQVLAARAASMSVQRSRVADKQLLLSDSPMFSEPVPVRRRLGQGSFRVVITDLYRRKCAVTGERALPTLEAAHIRPVTRDGRHLTSNGLLLRSDVHRLFDDGYVTVDRDLRFRVSSRLKKDFDNGEEYRRYAGQLLWVPTSAEDRPDPMLLEWHADTVFRK